VEACFTVASSGLRRERELGSWLPGFAATLLAACYEVVFRQTDAYLGPSLAPPRALSIALGLAGLAAGGWGGARAARGATMRAPLLLKLAVALSLVLAASGPAWFLAFQRPALMPLVAIALPSLAGALAGAALGALAQSGWLSYRELGSLRLLLSPLPLFGAVLVVVAAALGLSHCGLWRAGAAYALALPLFAAASARFHDLLCDPTPPGLRPAWLAIAAATASLGSAQAYVPGLLVAGYPNEIVWSDATGEVVVVSAQNTFQLFQARQLRVTSGDDYRLAELAVHPALANQRSPSRVLVVGPAGGFLEREVLRYRSVTQVVSISECPTASFRSSLWPAARGSLTDPRLSFVEAEVLPWLEQHQQTFDAIVVSQAVPTSHLEGKLFTRYFFELLAARISEGGVIAVQATSQAASPRTFATIYASIQATQLVTVAYEAPVPLLGALSFVLGRRGPISLHLRGLPSGLQYLHEHAVSAAPAPDSGPLTTLDQQRAVELWHLEQSALGDL
jgi:spermidine synthase